MPFARPVVCTRVARMKTPLLIVVFAATSIFSAEPGDSEYRRHQEAARAAGSSGELIQARNEWRAALRLARRPSSRIEALAGLGRVSRSLEAFDDAFAAFEKILKIAPTEVLAAFEIGRTASVCRCRTERGGGALMRYLMATPVGDMPTREEAEKLLAELASP